MSDLNPAQPALTARERLHRALSTEAFVRAPEATIVHRGSRTARSEGWLFDIRAITLSADVMRDIASEFWSAQQSPVQVGGLETAAIPLIASIVAHAQAHGRTGASGFFMRKSRKKDGLMNMIEGRIAPQIPIVLIDDLINSGSSFIRQVEVLEKLGHTVESIWTLVRFRDESYYEYFHNKNIAIHSLFSLDDFAQLGLQNLKPKPPAKPQQPFHILWRAESPAPSFQYVVPKSAPVLDESQVYMGTDRGTMRAYRQDSGALVWEYRIGHHPKGKGIFSTPSVHNHSVYFGGYDGNIYALNAENGSARWISFEADWIGSSPALAPELNTLFIGLEYGLWNKHGGIAALDMTTGKTLWSYRDMPCYTHASPRYIAQHKQVALGSNDGAVYLFDAQTGALIWKSQALALTMSERIEGFSGHDIKDSIAYDEKRDYLIAADTSGLVQILRRKDGVPHAHFQAEYGCYSTPTLYEDSVLVSSLDKFLYRVRLDGELLWKWHGGARLFATPLIIGTSVLQGSNTGRLSEIDVRTGILKRELILTERITNRPAYNAKTNRLFVSTFANELYCVEFETPTA